MSLLITILLSILSSNLVTCQVPYFSACPDVQVMQHFSPESYLGKWYEYEKYPFIFEIGGKCITAEYTLAPDGKIGVMNKQLNRILGSQNTIVGYAVPDEHEPAKLSVTFPSVSNVGSPYWVLGTDYQNYAVVWSCTDIWGGFASTRIAWILTRDKIPPVEALTQAYAILDTNGISKSFLMKTDNEGCDGVMV